jgi:hypothetical protein
MAAAHVLVCAPAGLATVGELHDQLCPPASDGTHFRVSTQESYLVDPGLEGVFAPPVAADIGQAFSVSFVGTMFLWLVSKGIGQVIQSVRDWAR